MSRVIFANERSDGRRVQIWADGVVDDEMLAKIEFYAKQRRKELEAIRNGLLIPKSAPPAYDPPKAPPPVLIAPPVYDAPPRAPVWPEPGASIPLQNIVPFPGVRPN
jgi:hypothetical protein